MPSITIAIIWAAFDPRLQGQRRARVSTLKKGGRGGKKGSGAALLSNAVYRLHIAPFDKQLKTI